jgi:hypothetical protein
MAGLGAFEEQPPTKQEMANREVDVRIFILLDIGRWCCGFERD